MRIIPAIDLINGKCVRLTQGDYNQKKIYNENPLEVAKEFEAAGIEYLHLVDLDGAKAGHVVNYDVIESICNNTNLKVDFGGGIQSNEDIEKVFNSGVQQITGGSIAIRNQEMFIGWIEKYGSEKIILGADVIGTKIAISGWQEETATELVDFLSFYIEKGIQYVICTDVAKDGLLAGTSIDLYTELMLKFPTLKLIASGGVTEIGELDGLKDINVDGAIIGKAIYEGRINIEELAKV
ncbi:MAG: 1-(5-phosphoribosyl)-5-[(5-phosphoribosylamino)methylideneamino]imidazole-4-carboxamide isomerase [Flavobacteriales bacterium]|nr:1-(5-phosphoribosyl)-5-[(5-phosphoribosylamino)methylideneamino]imidazole-4-carboxamide isomerase [Flavobacteriales bacterium]